MEINERETKRFMSNLWTLGHFLMKWGSNLDSGGRDNAVDEIWHQMMTKMNDGVTKNIQCLNFSDKKCSRSKL